MFSPGQKVLCIEGGWGQFGTGPNPWGVVSPRRGCVYHIRACWQSDSGAWWVHLEEIVNRKNRNQDGEWREPVFQAPQFVPIEDRDTAAQVDEIIRLSGGQRFTIKEKKDA